MGIRNVIGRFNLLLLLALWLLILMATQKAAAQGAQTELETTVFTMNNCIDYSTLGNTFVIKTKEELEAVIWTEGELCPKKAADIDFAKYTLIGIDIYNAECHGFSFKHKLIKNEAARVYHLQVTHPPLESICAGIYHHSLWILAPKLPRDYDVAFKINEVVSEKKQRDPYE